MLLREALGELLIAQSLLLFTTTAVWAQTIPDASLGAEVSEIRYQGTQDVVEGGVSRGNKLFHSFDMLNVEDGRSLYFANPAGIEQIFSRVTGNRPSNIDGILGVQGSADLFLLNPNGIVFGPDAQLDISGSFTATTAAGLQFEQFEFSATTPRTVPLLNISTAVGINFGSNPGPIVNRSFANGLGLSVEPSRSLSLLGGDITLEAGAITAVDGRIELQSQGHLSLINQSSIGVNNQTGEPTSQVRLSGSTITLDGASSLFSANTSDVAGANIVLEAQDLNVMDGSYISTVALAGGDGGSILADIPGQIALTNAAGDLTIGDPSFIRTTTLGTSTGGDIQVKTGDLLTEYNGFLASQTGASSTGNGGDVTIQAERSVTGRYISPIGIGGGIQVGTRGSGTGGSLTVQTSQLTLQDQHSLLSLSWRSGQGGGIQVEADQIHLDNASLTKPPTFSSIRSLLFGSGNGGDIEIATQALTLQSGANVSTLVELDRDGTIALASLLDPTLLLLLGLPDVGIGDAGDIEIVADTVVVDGFNPFVPAIPSQISSVTVGTGMAGDVNLSSRELKLLRGGGIGSSSLFAFSGQALPLNSVGGNGGDLTLNVDEITVSGSNPITELSSVIGTQTGSLGDAGNTTINTRRLSVLDGGLITSGTLTSGDGGDLTINAQESITVDGIHANGQVSTIGTFAFAPSKALRDAFSLPLTPQGETGELVVNSDRLTLSRGGLLSVSHQGTGDAGSLQVNVNQLLLRQRAELSATSLLGQGGNITLNVDDVLALRQNSLITAAALGERGNGGNLAISAGSILAIPSENSDIVASAKVGSGGTIVLRTGSLLGLEFRDQLTPQSDITASSGIGLNGVVNVDLLAVAPSQGLVELPATLLEPRELVATACRNLSPSRFVATGRGGLPIEPRRQLYRPSALQDWREPEEVSSHGALLASRKSLRSPLSLYSNASPASTPTMEAQGWVMGPEGMVQLTAELSEADIVETYNTLYISNDTYAEVSHASKSCSSLSSAVDETT